MSSPVPNRSKGVRLDSEERRRQILSAATRLFHERPYSQVSISDIADAAGVARGLLHHYFDSKRELYLEVVRDVARVPEVPVPDDEGQLETDEIWVRSVDGLLTLIEENATMWLNAVTVGGAESDDEVASILDDSREVMAGQTIKALGLGDEADTPELRALVRGYGGFVQELTLEWLERGRLTREQVREAMLVTLPLLLDNVLPRLDRS